MGSEPKVKAYMLSNEVHFSMQQLQVLSSHHYCDMVTAASSWDQGSSSSSSSSKGEYLEGGEQVHQILLDVIMHLSCQLHPSGTPTHLPHTASLIRLDLRDDKHGRMTWHKGT